MARFERSRGRKSNRDRSSRRDSRDSDSGETRKFEDYAKDKKDFRGRSSKRDRRNSGRSNRFGRDRPKLEMTKVTCSSCGIECEVPFKPTTNKPLFCKDCFSKKGKSNKNSNRDLEVINEKLDKIMKALDVE
jgi:CxxC-x17-CxxC domain-containing protein